MKKKIKISNLIFWGYLAVAYLAILIGLIFITFRAKKFVEHKPQFKLGKYTNVIQIQPFDTLYLKGYTKLVVKYYPDTNLLAFNGQVQIQQNRNSLFINQGNDIELFTSKKHLVIDCGGNLDMVASKIDDIVIKGKDVHLSFAAGNLNKLNLNFINSVIDLAATSINTIDLNVKNTRINVASMTVKKVVGYADSSSILSMVHLFRTKIKLKGGAKVEAKKK